MDKKGTAKSCVFHDLFLDMGKKLSAFPGCNVKSMREGAEGGGGVGSENQIPHKTATAALFSSS